MEFNLAKVKISVKRDFLLIPGERVKSSQSNGNRRILISNNCISFYGESKCEM